MRRSITALFAWLRSLDPNQRNYWMGLFLLLIGLTFFASFPLALTVVGGVMAVESVITSYLAGLLKSRAERESE